MIPWPTPSAPTPSRLHAEDRTPDQPLTRINLVPPAELCDQHLLAEHRELTRIPNAVARGRFSLAGQPDDYKLGEGHVRFFFDKLAFLKRRYEALHAECRARGFHVSPIWPADLPADARLWRDYTPTSAALAASRERIAQRMPAKARFTPHQRAPETSKPATPTPHDPAHPHPHPQPRH